MPQENRTKPGATASPPHCARRSTVLCTPPKLVAAGRLWAAATSFGGLHSTVDRRAQWGGDAVAPGFVRFSCGIEDTADVVADLSSALDAALGERALGERALGGLR